MSNQKKEPEVIADAEPSLTYVRKALLDRVIADQAQRITELQRRVEKKRIKYERLSSSSMYVPPTMPAPPSARPPAPQENLNSANSTSQPQQTTPNMMAAVAAMAAANPQVSAPLPGHFPFLFHHPDHPYATMMGVVPPPPANPPVQPPPASSPTAQPESDKKQSRYWTPEEHQRFLAAVNTCGPRNYTRISEFVGTRNAKQVRTHAQKYQQRLEREKAKRHSSARAAVDSTHTSIGAAAVAAVAEAAAVTIHGNVPGASPSSTPVVNDVALVGTGAPTSSSSGKKFQNTQAKSAGSTDGSSSTNEVSGQQPAASSTIGAKGAQFSTENATAAAMAAVAAEAVALGGGKLPAGIPAVPIAAKLKTMPSAKAQPAGKSTAAKGTVNAAAKSSGKTANASGVSSDAFSAPMQPNVVVQAVKPAVVATKVVAIEGKASVKSAVPIAFNKKEPSKRVSTQKVAPTTSAGSSVVIGAAKKSVDGNGTLSQKATSVNMKTASVNEKGSSSGNTAKVSVAADKGGAKVANGGSNVVAATAVGAGASLSTPKAINVVAKPKAVPATNGNGTAGVQAGGAAKSSSVGINAEQDGKKVTKKGGESKIEVEKVANSGKVVQSKIEQGSAEASKAQSAPIKEANVPAAKVSSKDVANTKSAAGVVNKRLCEEEKKNVCKADVNGANSKNTPNDARKEGDTNSNDTTGRHGSKDSAVTRVTTRASVRAKGTEGTSATAGASGNKAVGAIKTGKSSSNGDAAPMQNANKSCAASGSPPVEKVVATGESEGGHGVKKAECTGTSGKRKGDGVDERAAKRAKTSNDD